MPREVWTWGATELLGGGPTSLDFKPYASLQDGDLARTSVTDDYTYHHIYDAASEAVEASPLIIKPDDAGENPGRWVFVGVFAAKFRTGEATNYLDISSGGVVTLAGTAKRHLLLRPSLDMATVAVKGKPAINTRGAHRGFVMPIYSADDQELFIHAHLPRRWDGTTNLILPLTVALGGIEDIGDKFNFQASYSVIEVGKVVPDTPTDAPVETTVLAGRVAAYDVYEVDFTIDVTGMEVGDVLGVRVRRLAASTLEVTASPIIYCFDVDHTIDKLYGDGG